MLTMMTIRSHFRCAGYVAGTILRTIELNLINFKPGPQQPFRL